MESTSINDTSVRKLPYVPPLMEVYDFVVECGVGNSINDAHNKEEIHEMTTDEGELWRGEWY